MNSLYSFFKNGPLLLIILVVFLLFHRGEKTQKTKSLSLQNISVSPFHVFVTIFYVLFQPFRVPVCLLLLCPNKFSVSPLQSSLPQDPQKALPTSPFSERPSLLRWRTQGQGLGPLIAWPIKVAGSSKNPHGSGQTTSEPCPGPLRLSCTVH